MAMKIKNIFEMTGQALRLFVENLLVKMHFDKRTSADAQVDFWLTNICQLTYGRQAISWQTFGWKTFGWQTFGWQTFGWKTFGWQTFGWHTFGWKTFGWKTFGKLAFWVTDN
jgi:hypothetical protein